MGWRKRNTGLKKKDGDKDKAEQERTDAIGGHGDPQRCMCIMHRAQRSTGGKQQ